MQLSTVSSNPFFRKNADGYAKSESHKRGHDLETLINLMSPKGTEKLLDIATGTGFTAAAFSPLVKEIVAIDPTREMLQKAIELATENDIRNIRFLNLGWEELRDYEEFDLAVCRRAAHHFQDKQAFFSKVYKVLRPGGKFGYVDMVTPDEDFSGFFNSLERTRDPTHVYALKVAEILQIANNSGFKQIGLRIENERLTFDNWLYPVSAGSPEGKRCLDYLASASEDNLRLIDYDRNDNSFVKRRAVVVFRKD
ncbi:MAG TPA: methyltransferase domain-containing protein [Thermoplasmataceae archaeon]|nr:methyltransferase domain-containing protein [Thermoplasmatales archaeon AK]HLH86174.1 methyltransferase domain-containing protein [Thermoplasmataceae archaeon]